MAQALDDARRSPPGSVARVPPHNLEAEESLLGAMLLSRDAIVAAVEAQLGPDDFYKPAHGHVFEAVTALYGQGEPADPVTVAEELRRAGLLEGIGGPATLISLQARTPAIGNATRYARIVEEYALLRRLIAVAGEIAEMGYSVPDDVLAAIDAAEALVFDVAQRRVTDSMLPIRELLERHLDHIEALYERGQDIIGVPTGYVDLDQQLAGLQPSNLVIVGGRPGTGKALGVDTPIPTPTGWTTMGDLAPGDEVLDEQGQPCRVTFATPVMRDHLCYEVVFDEGSTLVADADHQWFVYDTGDPGSQGEPRVVTTEQMLREGERTGRRQRPTWHIPVARPLDLPEADLPIHPYALGRSISESQSEELLDRVRGVLVPSRRSVRSYQSSSEVPSAERPVDMPGRYLRASMEQRLALLQGILETSRRGTASTRVDVCLLNRELLEQVRELVCSLGQKPGPIQELTMPLPRGRWTRAWEFGWSPVDCPLAGRRAITAIRPVPSVPVRCITVDSPNQLYLAGREMIPTHNTSFSLGMAAHAALDGRHPVLVFSLEMSHLELTQRLLCSEARVDATRMRNGRLLETDWPKISHAVGRLAEAPIHIDDNPHLTVMEIRAKARRLKSRQGLGLIVVDYLQLMTGRQSAENRQVEVSEISRGLKILARELEIPVVALSQLSRNLETRADKRPVLADLRESGGMPAATRLLRADNGQEISLGGLVLSQEQPLVWSVDEHQRLVPARLVSAFPSGIKPVFTLHLASGRSVTASANHRFLTTDGWTRLDALKVGAFVATPRRVPAPAHPSEVWSDDELALLAHMLGDGTMGTSFKYATADPANKELVEDLAHRLFGITVEGRKVANTWQLWFPSPYRLTHGVNHPMRNWLEPHGLWKARAWTKFCPQSVFGLSDERIALFLRHLWATDGSITLGRNGRGPTVRTYYATTSRQLALDVQRLLLRLGIRSSIGSSRKQRVGGSATDGQTYREGYSVRIQGAACQARFLRLVGCHGQRGDCIPEALTILDRIKENPNVDLVPWPVAARVKAAAARAGVTQRQIADHLGERYCGSYLLGNERRPRRFARDRLSAIATIVESQELSDIATSDLYWDRVTEITADGPQPTFDATVVGTHNFIADGVVAHNSLEQDADVVIFLYRDELYNRDSPDRGTAEVIVAKHRNGPTGMTQLAFLENYTRFANMARGV